jgi:hypothetical protein
MIKLVQANEATPAPLSLDIDLLAQHINQSFLTTIHYSELRHAINLDKQSWRMDYKAVDATAV